MSGKMKKPEARPPFITSPGGITFMVLTGCDGTCYYYYDDGGKRILIAWDRLCRTSGRDGSGRGHGKGSVLN